MAFVIWKPITTVNTIASTATETPIKVSKVTTDASRLPNIHKHDSINTPISAVIEMMREFGI